MIRSANDNLSEAEETNPVRFCRERYVDIHCHCLPAIDDGPVTMSDALALCRALADDGIGTAVATPHQLGRFNECNSAPKVREAVSILNGELKSSGIGFTVMPGADVRVDERICQLLESDKILTLADGGRHILLELPHGIFIDIEPLLVDLSDLGIQAVISHPERHSVLAKQPKLLLKWLNRSACLQVTAGSLLGKFGLMAQRAAWFFLSSAWAPLVATDSHGLDGRAPCMGAAFERISIELGREVARLVCIENPLRVLNGLSVTTAVGPVGARECSDERALSSF